MSDNQPGGPESGDQDTAPIWSPEDRYPATDDRDGPAQDADQPVYDRRPPYDPPAYDTYSYPYGSGWSEPTQHLPYPGWYEQPSQTRSSVPGWLWPVVAATALVVGLIGGATAGALVSTTMDGGAVDTSTLDADEAAPAPLKLENGSVAAVAKALLPSTVQIVTRGGDASPLGQGGGTGSGFVVDRKGHVITNNHVVSGAADDGRIQVIDHAGRRHTATIVGRSPVYDIAVLQVTGAERLQPAALGSSRSMNVGETVVAIGSPLGLGSSVTSGIISALDRPVTTGDQDESSYINAVQTDAAINPGNSGGPLVNLRGEVVGVNSAIATMGSFAGEGGNIGVGFAIPMEQVKITASQILSTGEAKYPVIGANVNTGSRRNGAEVIDVPNGTPADRAGLRKGDIVVAVDGKPVSDGIGLIVAIRSHQPGETVELTVRREGGQETVNIRLDAKVG